MSTGGGNKRIDLGLTPGRFTALAIFLGVVIFLALNVLVQTSLRQARLDLTQNGLYTLSEGTKESLRAIDEPITLRFFYSQRLGTSYPSIHRYATRVRDLLEEYAARADGGIILEVIDPEPFTAEEDMAVALGLQGVPVQSGDTLYFGLTGTNTVDGRETIPFFLEERARFLEYDLTEMVTRLNATERPRLGILSALPLAGTPQNPMAPGSGSPPMLIYQQLAQQFELDTLPETFRQVPDDIEVLLLAHPRALDEDTAYAIDQFAMAGGRVIAIVDPFAEAMAGSPMQPGAGPAASNLPRLLPAWGVMMDDGRFVADRRYAQLVSNPGDPRRPSSRYVAWLALDDEALAEDDILTADLERVLMPTAGALMPAPEATTTLSPLFTSSDDAMLLPVEAIRFQPDPDTLLRTFLPTGERYVMAARLSGAASSAFDGPPASEILEEGEEGPTMAEAEDVPLPPHVAETEALNVIVIADSDFLQQRFWARVQNFLGQTVVVPTADNGNFLIGAVENLMGSDALISLRARAPGDRPFTLVERLRARAESRYLAEEQSLQNEIDATEARLAELQGQGRDMEAGLVLTDAQQAEIARFRQELAATRARLRDVQRSLRADIESLGATVKFANIALMPLVVAGVAIGLALWQRRQRRRRAAGVAEAGR